MKICASSDFALALVHSPIARSVVILCFFAIAAILTALELREFISYVVRAEVAIDSYLSGASLNTHGREMREADASRTCSSSANESRDMS